MDAFEGVVDAVVEVAPNVKPSRPVRAFLFDVVMFVVLMVGIGLLAGIGLAIVDGGDAEPGVMAMLWLVILATGGPALVLYLWRRRATPAERAASYAALRRPSTWAWTVGTAAVVFVVVNTLQWALSRAQVEVVPTNLPVIEQGLAVNPAFLLLFAAVIAPAYEELLFRRVLFGRLWAAGKPWLGMVLSSAVFALIHEVPGTTGNPLEVTLLLWLVYGGMGAAFAWVYWRTGTLWAAFGAHALHNFASVALLLG